MITDYATPNTATMTDIPLAWLTPSPFNPRRQFDDEALDELAASLTQHGMLEPIVVRETNWPAGVQVVARSTGAAVPCMEIIAGERRWRAATRAGLEYVPVRVLADVDDKTALQLAIVENLQRVDLDPIEEAQGFAALHEYGGMKQTEIAAAVKRSQPTIAKSMGLLKLPEEVQALIRDGTLSAGHGHILAPWAPFPAYLAALAAATVQQRWSTKVLAEQKYFSNYELVRTGIVRSVDIYETRFDKKICESCPFGAYRTEYSRGYCLRPEHYDELQAAAIAEQQERLAIAVAAGVTGGDAVLQKSSLKYDEYKSLDSYTPPAGCSETCPCRALAADVTGKIGPICTNPKRYDHLKVAETKAVNKAKRERVAKQIEIISEQLQGLEEIRSTELAMLAWTALNTAGEKMWRAAAAHHGLLELLPEKGALKQEDLARLAPLDLVRLAVDTLLTFELTRSIESDYYGTPNAIWYRQQPRER